MKRLVTLIIAALLCIITSCSNVAQPESDGNDTQQVENTTYETLIYNDTDMIITGVFTSINEIEPGRTGTIKGVNEQEIALHGRFKPGSRLSRAENAQRTSILVYITTLKPKDVRCLYISRNIDGSIGTKVILRY